MGDEADVEYEEALLVEVGKRRVKDKALRPAATYVLMYTCKGKLTSYTCYGLGMAMHERAKLARKKGYTIHGLFVATWTKLE